MTKKNLSTPTRAICTECGHDSDDHDNGGCSFVTSARKNGRPITICPCERWAYEVESEARGDTHE